MARIKLSLVIIILITVGSILSTYTVQRKYHKLLTMIEKSQELVEDGKQEEAVAEADKIIEYWDKLHKGSNIFVRSDKIADIHSSIARIKPYIVEESEDINAEFESLKEMVRWLYESEMPYPSNIF